MVIKFSKQKTIHDKSKILLVLYYSSGKGGEQA